MKVVAGGQTIDLGTLETTPTIGITDYSKRVTDDFGVTTVVPRGFSRKMSVRLGVPFTDVDALQRRLADLRATSAQWIADDRFQWLSAQGFYKDFSIDLASPPMSYCTLTVEGVAETEVVADTGGDPAPAGQASTLQLLQPVDITAAMLASISVPEADYPAWASGTTYAAGARVIKAATHRIYESLVAGNVGHDPASDATMWLDVAPTNRWAMFDQALGTATVAPGSITLTFVAGAVKSLALLDVVGTTVRVQTRDRARSLDYDRTVASGPGAVLFFDLPAPTDPLTVTIAGSGTVKVGTLLIGSLTGLGITEASPTAGITDYSRKEVDDFGAVTIVQRAWSKVMSAKALIRTTALDLVANRIAAVRAQPVLWVGQVGVDSLTVYGFFKDFSIEVEEATSKLSLSIEGLSQAAPASTGQLGGPTAWPDVTNPDPINHPKPEDGATNSANPDSAFGPEKTVAEALADIEAARQAAADLAEQADALGVQADAIGEQARAAIVAALQSQLIADATKLRAEASTLLAGQKVRLVLKQEITNREEGDATIQEQVNLLGVVTEDGSAFVLDMDRVLVGPGLTLAAHLAQITADAGGGNYATVMQLNEAKASAVQTSATALQQVVSQFNGDLGTKASTTDLNQAVTTLNDALAQAIREIQAGANGDMGGYATLTYVDLAKASAIASSATALQQLAARSRQGAPNLLLNSDASDGLNHWTAGPGWFVNSLPGTVGKWFECPPSGVARYLVQRVSLQAGAPYCLSIEADPDNGSSDGHANVNWIDAAGVQIGGPGLRVDSDSWQRAASAVETSPPGAVAADVVLLKEAGAGGSFRGTRVQLQAGPATDWRDDASAAYAQAGLTQLKTAIVDEAGARVTQLDQRTAQLQGAIATKASVTDLQQTNAAVGGKASASDLQQVSAYAGQVDGRVTTLRQVVVDAGGAVSAKAMIQLDANGRVAGLYATNDGHTADLVMLFDHFTWLRPNGQAMIANTGNLLRLYDVEIDRLKINTAVVPQRSTLPSPVQGGYGSASGTAGPHRMFTPTFIYMPLPGWIEVTASLGMGSDSNGPWNSALYIDGNALPGSGKGGGNSADSVFMQGGYYADHVGWYRAEVGWEAWAGTRLTDCTPFVKGFPSTG